MYSMVLVASLATAGDAPEFGKKSSGAGCTGCTGVVVAPAGCSGVVVESAGCTGGGRQGLFGRHKSKGEGCSGSVPAGCSGVIVQSAGCGGMPAGCSGGGRVGLFGRHKDKGAGCSGVTVVAAPCGCCGSEPAVVVPVAEPAKEMPKVETKKQ